mmetsp:Transcript_28363/g.62093  ORF Transcript_28363/g.62093 Transcript_28363/m.62093 type:complete len:206 (-) Transcript_28363:953-1570(-)
MSAHRSANSFMCNAVMPPHRRTSWSALCCCVSTFACSLASLCVANNASEPCASASWLAVDCSEPETKHAETMSAPPKRHEGDSVSPKSTNDQRTAHKGSVAKMTVASAEEISPSTAASSTQHAAVVTTPVHTSAPMTGVCAKGSDTSIETVPPSLAKASEPPVTPTQPIEMMLIATISQNVTAMATGRPKSALTALCRCIARSQM